MGLFGLYPMDVRARWTYTPAAFKDTLVDPQLLPEEYDEYPDDGAGGIVPVWPRRPLLTEWDAPQSAIDAAAAEFFAEVLQERLGDRRAEAEPWIALRQRCQEHAEAAARRRRSEDVEAAERRRRFEDVERTARRVRNVAAARRRREAAQSAVDLDLPPSESRDERAAMIPLHRFMERVVRVGDCWIWSGSFNRGGYGQLSVRVNGAVRSIQAHRCAYELLVGPVPDGCHLHHSCWNRACVRPEHLKVMSPSAHHRMHRTNA